ncbi:hypothetical protein E4U57_005039 [Claviceps arundinis]|uniref:Uncharacterized protein n=1 Tax=Claviceps arundinis TaxID=1623583 RepID=A0A9P7MVM0_9HYPO|nr:hypothetical protein E4U57_005039 [Claviceps arundinis]KAG5972491.1 hypothetical protein E4U56_005973 [Claviceps arundinis]
MIVNIVVGPTITDSLHMLSQHIDSQRRNGINNTVSMAGTVPGDRLDVHAAPLESAVIRDELVALS